jgi:hypothetical protein
MRLNLPSCLIVVLALPVQAGNTTPSGTKVIETGQPFDAFIKKLTKAIWAKKWASLATPASLAAPRPSA